MVACFVDDLFEIKRTCKTYTNQFKFQKAFVKKIFSTRSGKLTQTNVLVWDLATTSSSEKHRKHFF